MTVTRRDVMEGAMKAAAGLAVGGGAWKAFGEREASPPATGRKLKVLVTGGHPGDPECGCGGVIARYTDAAHEVALLYLNRGELYCGTHPRSECGTVRTGEAEKACGILKARPVFATQTDGRAMVDVEHYDAFQKLYDAQGADVVFAQWPIDGHRDHRAISSLVLDAWLKSDKRAALYYYEVAEDTMSFSPSVFVDISAVEGRKREACFAHASQGPEKWYPLQEQITKFRGTESGWVQAEGFVRHAQSRGGGLV